MNYLAHLALAEDNAHSRIGNLLGDFRKGVDVEALPVDIYHGLQNHYRVDRLTDGHNDVKALRELISPKRRRFAGIITDIAFDYFLCKHWDNFMSQDFDEFAESCYTHFSDSFDDIPEPMQPAMARMIQYDWLHAYHTLEGVERAIDRVAERVRFKNELAGGIEDVEHNTDQIEACFLALFPELKAST